MKVVITERDVPASGDLRIPPLSIVTDSAREAAAAVAVAPAAVVAAPRHAGAVEGVDAVGELPHEAEVLLHDDHRDVPLAPLEHVEHLHRFAALPPTPLELEESLEQLRALEHGIRIRVADTAYRGFGIDTPEDLARARALLGAA